MSYTIVETSDRETWLASRRKGIGASDAAAVLGCCPFRSPLDVWADKRGLGKPREETPAMRRGLVLESWILDEAERNLGCGPMRRQVFAFEDSRPWQLATVDGLTDDGTIVEAKSVNWRQARRWGEPGTDEVPENYLLQVQHQLAVFGLDHAVIAAEIGGDLNFYRVQRDDRLIDRMTEIEAAFWAGVLEGIAPPVTSPADAEILARLNPPSEAAIELPDDVANLANRYESLGRRASELERERSLAKAEILAAMGAAGRGILPDGRVVLRKTIRREACTVKASEYQTLTVKGGAR